MAYAIMRWAKVTSQVQADKATGHNYRTDKVANADKEAPHPNVELVNIDGRGYWELATERIAEVVTRKVRDDQVRCMEVILTASPEFFERDANGRAVDMKDSQWLKDQLTFLEKTFGKENVLSCTLHQDEKSPHVHAVIAPITKDDHLSAKRLFNPITMTDYQSQYAEVMKVHGLERGVEHSQAEHQPMKKMYGQQGQTAAELEAQLGPASSYQDVQVKRPGVLDLRNLAEWEAKNTAQLNEKARAQVEEANKRAEKAQTLALENASAKEQVRVLQKQLSTSEGLKENHKAQSEEAAKRIASGEAPDLWVKRGNKLLDEAIGHLRDGLHSLRTFESWGDADRIKEQTAKNKAMEADLGRFAGGKTRLVELDKETARGKEGDAAILKYQAEKRAQDEITDNQNRARAAIARTTTHELSLMDRTIKVYWPRVSPDELKACLIVPKEKVENVEKSLQIPGSVWAMAIRLGDEPARTDGKIAVYAHYQPDFAPQASKYFELVREGGGQVYEHAPHQAQREKLTVQPVQKVQGPVVEPAQTKSTDVEIGG